MRCFKMLWVVLLIVSWQCYGWGPIGHYVITKEAVGQNIAEYANLPDIWASQEGVLAFLNTGVYFRWSHGVLDHGHYTTTGGAVWVPKIPTFPDDGRYPGIAMKKLLDDKIDHVNNNWGDSAVMRLVQKGFRAHNAADKIVHWGFFLGAADGMTNQEKEEAWTIHHGLKETWAEYIILRDQYTNKTIVFNSNGTIAPPANFSLGMSNIATKVSAMANIIQIAQKVYRKNRTRHHAVEAGESDVSENWAFAPQSVATITGLIINSNTELNGHFNQANWARWEAAYFNFLTDYIISNPDGTTTTISFDTPNTLQAEYNLLLWAEQKFLNETELLPRRQMLGFVWNRVSLMSKISSSKSTVTSWVNE